MRILFLYQYFGTPKGSWSTRVYELCYRWVLEGHEVEVITAPYTKSDIRAKAFITKENVDGINVTIINSGDNNRLPLPIRALKAIIFSVVSIFYALFKKYDVIIASSGPITIGFPMILARIVRRKKTVFEVRDLWPSGAIEMGLIKNPLLIRIGYWFEKWCYKSASLVVPCSVGMQDSIIRRFPGINTLTIPNASDIKLFKGNSKKFERPNNRKYFLYAGSLGAMDSVGEIIEACKYIKHRDDFLIYIIGAGAEKEMLENITITYGLENKVMFLGLIPKEELVSWFVNSYASFVLFKNYPVLSTSSPNKMFDSFAAGVPIIQNTEGWIKDLVSNAFCGINVKPNEPEVMSEAMGLLLDDENLRDEMAKNAYLLALNDFNRDKLAYDYLETLISLQEKFI